MLISLSHGKRILVYADKLQKGYYGNEYVDAKQVYRQAPAPADMVPADGDDMPPQEPDAPDRSMDQTVPLAPREAFRYLLSDTQEISPLDQAAEKLDALGAAMAETVAEQDSPPDESSLPPFLTYLGQFIDHDITANTDREDDAVLMGAFNIDKPALNPQNRSDVETFKTNLRKGNLGLDSVYGDGPGQDDMISTLEAALRDPVDSAKMRLGQLSPIGTTIGMIRENIPADDNADIPRFGAIIDEGIVTLAEVREMFTDPSKPAPTEAQLRRKPLLGDMRNDENLLVAQTHLAFLRFHNAIVDKMRADGTAPADDEELFLKAREQVTWTYQWMVTNVFLKAICDEDVWNETIDKRAPIYQDFFDAHRDTLPEGVRPMPLEFSVAFFRYGHSMVRGRYDFNQNFGRAADGTGDGRATFEELFQFTGNGGFAESFGFPTDTLPDNWIIDWNRFIGGATLSNRVARKIDTKLALPLHDLRNEMSGLMKKLAARNLRRGYVFNLPDAQTLHDGLTAAGATLGAKLTEDELKSGRTGDAVEDGNFHKSTPLWFYTLKEAELKADGEHLGPLGSSVVAETVFGLMATDPSSYLFAGSGGFNSWTPDDGVQPLGEPINSFPALLRAGGLLGIATS